MAVSVQGYLALDESLGEWVDDLDLEGMDERKARFVADMIRGRSVNEALEILTGLRDTFEAHHRVRIADCALEASVDLAIRYISNRFLPDKAIDVLDEACSSERLERTTRPPDVTKVESEIEQLEREKNEAVFAQDFELAAEVRDRLESAKEEKDRVLLEWKQSTKEVDGAIDADAIRRTIAAMTENFCASCNRIRITARGDLHACLANDAAVDLRTAPHWGDLPIRISRLSTRHCLPICYW